MSVIFMRVAVRGLRGGRRGRAVSRSYVFPENRETQVLAMYKCVQYLREAHERGA